MEMILVPQKLVQDYVDHLAQTELHKEKQRTESERQQTQQVKQDYNDIVWDHLYQKLSLKVHELNCSWHTMGSCLFKGRSQLYLQKHISVAHRMVHPLSWCDGLSTSMTRRAMPAGAYAPGRVTHAGQVEG